MYQITTGLSFLFRKTKVSIYRTIKLLPEHLQIILTTILLKILQVKLYIPVLVSENKLNHQLYTRAELTVSILAKAVTAEINEEKKQDQFGIS